MNIDEQIKVMQAYRDGAEIECHSGMMLMSNPAKEQWMLTANPIWNWENRKYRIKEAPKTVTLEWWLNKFCNEIDIVQPSQRERDSAQWTLIKTETIEVSE